MDIEKKKEEMAKLMSEISEWWWFAAWIIGNEYALWDLINNESLKKCGMCDAETDSVLAEYLQKLKILADDVGQWPMWDDNLSASEAVDGLYLRWVSIDEWKQILFDKRNYV